MPKQKHKLTEPDKILADVAREVLADKRSARALERKMIGAAKGAAESLRSKAQSKSKELKKQYKADPKRQL
tara:strand:- start:381 stop:593 length:213 start_codon:yes stop_codon:yes gene_type:complete